MIVIPEIETVLILTPRTGSGSLRRAVMGNYPQAMMVYRHMEACGVPRGYDRWNKLGVVREPLSRLWSLYKFMRDYDNPDHCPEYVASINLSATMPFSDWITDNATVFTSPYDSSGMGRFYPKYTVNHPIPENMKSQFMYLRPDLGTAVHKFSELSKVAEILGVILDQHNKTITEPMPYISGKAEAHIERVFSWDLDQTA